MPTQLELGEINNIAKSILKMTVEEKLKTVKFILNSISRGDVV